MVGNQDKDKKEKCPRLLVAPAIENPPRHHQIQKSGNRRAEPRLFGVIPRAVSRTKNTPLTRVLLCLFLVV